MTFHAALVASAVWPADIVASGIVPDAAAVYVGRFRRDPGRSDREVWIEPVELVEESRQGFQRLQRYVYRVHVVEPGNKDGAGAAQTQLDSVIAALEVVVKRYHGRRPFSATLNNLVSVFAQVEQFDRDPTAEVQDGVVRFEFMVKE